MAGVLDVIEKRRAYRSLIPAEITDELIRDLAYSASLAPSCYNKQPWRFVFVRDKNRLEELFGALPTANNWAKKASMIVIVYSRRDLDCIIEPREYYLFDTGIAVGFMVLRATELGLVAHPIAGYDHEKVREFVGLDRDCIVITLIVIGKWQGKIAEDLSDKQKELELVRPSRKDFDQIAKII